MEPFEIIASKPPRSPATAATGRWAIPRVYLTLSKDGEIECPYCSRRYVLKARRQRRGH